MFANPRKTKGVMILGPVDIQSLRRDVSLLTEQDWAAENEDKPNRFDVLDETQHIVFRFLEDLSDIGSSYDRPRWAAWRERLMPVMDSATAAYNYRSGVYPRIMLARMRPGGKIHPHVDASDSAAWPHKIHIPLTTNPDVVFYVEPSNYHLEEGCAYEVNNRCVHAVDNGGSEHRIHLIFEYYDAEQAR